MLISSSHRPPVKCMGTYLFTMKNRISYILSEACENSTIICFSRLMMEIKKQMDIVCVMPRLARFPIIMFLVIHLAWRIKIYHSNANNIFTVHLREIRTTSLRCNHAYNINTWVLLLFIAYRAIGKRRLSRPGCVSIREAIKQHFLYEIRNMKFSLFIL